MSARDIVTGQSLPKLVNLATELSKAGPPVDFVKIALVRQAIAQGEYSVDVDRIAHAMVGFFRTAD
jgi:negative regulator of flagellin synthesis FlgM